MGLAIFPYPLFDSSPQLLLKVSQGSITVSKGSIFTYGLKIVFKSCGVTALHRTQSAESQLYSSLDKQAELDSKSGGLKIRPVQKTVMLASC